MGTTNLDTVAMKTLVVNGKTLTADVDDLNAGVTGTIAGLTATPTELNKLAAVTAGTAAASKALVLGASKDIDTLVLTGTLKRSVGTIAAAGANQGNAAAVTKEITQVTASDDAKGVVLPTAVAGMEIVVINTVSAKNLLVYPASGAAIDYGSADAAYTLAGRKHARFYAYSATQWYAILGA